MCKQCNNIYAENKTMYYIKMNIHLFKKFLAYFLIISYELVNGSSKEAGSSWTTSKAPAMKFIL
jgi:hypothetical protein